MKTIKILALLFTVAFIGQSCRKDSDNFTVLPPIIEPQIMVTGSVLGTVKDNNGNAIEDAKVSFEGNIVFTDDHGVFQFIDEELYSSGTFIKIAKDGFFEGSRRFYASEGKTSIVSIELMPLEEVGEFASSNGSVVTFEKVVLDFKPNSIMNEDGTAFSGNVNVAAKYLDPTLLSTLNQMPGDLTGTTIDQNRVALISLAMIAVELLDDSGNALQVQQGQTVDVKIPVPETLLNSAPATIPMWHFDEEVGTWVEEGSATLVNGMYEASLAHFSFWNCDVPNDYIFLKGSITNRIIPIQGVSVVVTIAGGGASGSAITDANGFFCGFVPNGVDLTLEIFDQCGNLIYTQTIPASEVDIFLDPINLNLETNVATISGTVSLCEDTPSLQTYVTVTQGTLSNVLPINADFTFSANIFYCEDDSEIAVGAIDPVNALASAISTYSISGNLDVGEIVLCEEQISSILILEYGDNSETIIFDLNSLVFITYNLQKNIPIGMQGGEILYMDIYTVTTLDWVTNVSNTSVLPYVEGTPLQDAIVQVAEGGFQASGMGTTQKVTQGGKTYLKATGTLSDIVVTDPALYDPSYSELFYYLVFKIN